MIKLTAAQEKLLREIAAQTQFVSPSYPPRARLLDLGLIEERAGRFTSQSQITDAGREWLTRADQS